MEKTPGGSKQLKDVHVIGVERLDNYDACLKCSSDLIPNTLNFPEILFGINYADQC